MCVVKLPLYYYVNNSKSRYERLSLISTGCTVIIILSLFHLSLIMNNYKLLVQNQFSITFCTYRQYCLIL